MGFQVGNTNRQRQKLFFDALMLEMRACEEKRGMRIIARKLLDLAVSGDIQAIKEVVNRVDGIPVQQIDNNTEHSIFVAALPQVAENTAEWMKLGITEIKRLV